MRTKTSREDWMLGIGTILIVQMIGSSIYNPIAEERIGLMGNMVLKTIYEQHSPIVSWVMAMMYFTPERFWALILGMLLIFSGAYLKSRKAKNKS